MAYSIARESGGSGAVYSFFASSSVLILALNSLGFVGTFGAAIIITIPLSYIYLLCYQFVNYCDNNNIKYFTDSKARTRKRDFAPAVPARRIKFFEACFIGKKIKSIILPRQICRGFFMHCWIQLFLCLLFYYFGRRFTLFYSTLKYIFKVQPHICKAVFCALPALIFQAVCLF